MKPQVQYFLLAILLLLLTAGELYAQGRPAERYNVSKPEELKDLKDLYNLGNKILREKKSCVAKKDFKEECVCAKAQDYQKLEEMVSLYMGKYPAWDYKILQFDNNGTPAKTSFEYYNQKITTEFYNTCWYDGTGKVLVNHDSDYPVLKLKKDEDIKDLKRLHSYMGKQMNYESKCMSAGYSYNQCRCGNKEFYERYKLAFKLTKEKHPEWVGKVLQYSKGGESMAQTLDNYERNMIVRDNFCIKKKQSNSPPPKKLLP